MKIQQTLIAFICENFMVEEEEIIVDQSLVDQGIIDSFGLVEIASFLKSEYGVETTTEDMNIENFGSVEKIIAYTQRSAN